MESGQLFDLTVTNDLAAIKQSCSDDFWRQQLYSRQLWEAAVLTADYQTPDRLLASISGFPTSGLTLDAKLHIYPSQENLGQALSELKKLAGTASQALETNLGILSAAFDEQKFKASYMDAFSLHEAELSVWLHGQSVELPGSDAFDLLTSEGLEAGLNGIKFKGNKSQTSTDRKAEYLASLNIDTAPFDALALARNKIPLAIRRQLLEVLRGELDKRLQELNVLSFDGMISRLYTALQGDKGVLLAKELRERFAVALIDEFQDTDDNQWSIFSTVFEGTPQPLYLIGDPKQAIYKFRGADIYSYLTAQQQAEHRYTLGFNWRSHPHLVSITNALFKRERAFLLDDLAFTPVNPAKSAADGFVTIAGASSAPMVFWQLPEADSKTGYWTAGKAGEAIRQAVVNEIVRLLEQAEFQPQRTPIQPRDIAILVRSNAQARDYQAALRESGVPSVLNNTESVFASQEALDLFSLLQAIANPGNITFLKEALALDWFGLDGQRFYSLSNNEADLDNWLRQFLTYNQDWQKKGLLAMMQRVLAHTEVRTNLAGSLLAERRLTNLHHLVELLQQAALDGHLGINKTLDWLRSAIAKPDNHENQQLRLESDDDSVKIITMHRSKGLEYPIVFCPYLWQSNDRLAREKNLVTCHAEVGMVADLGSEHFAHHRELAEDEALAEDLRLCYVAITRAKFRCYIAWADVRSEHNANTSALAWLLDFGDNKFAEQTAKFKAFGNADPEASSHQILDLLAPSHKYQKPASQAQLSAKKRHRSLYTNWQMSSYTALSALSLTDTPELPEDKSGEQDWLAVGLTDSAVGSSRSLSEAEADSQATAWGFGFAQPTISNESTASGLPAGQGAALTAWEHLPRGSQAGNVVHSLLEKIDFADLAANKDIRLDTDKFCQRYGVKMDKPELLGQCLNEVVKTPLSDADHSFCLMNLPSQHCLKEMPFYLSMAAMDTVQINTILRGTTTYQDLDSKTLCGYLTGFIDLVCMYQGRYYVMDYKTNTLPDYSEASLNQAMRDHNYGLQYWLYTLVLHRYLQNRLPEYDYDSHFGGVRYLFVRGMQADMAMSGVFHTKPDLARVQALAELFS